MAEERILGQRSRAVEYAKDFGSPLFDVAIYHELKRCYKDGSLTN